MADVLMAVMGFCYPPIGGIIAWHKDLSPDMPSLPVNWVECSGGVLNDPESPLHGVTLPDLNGGNRFLRGNATSGGTGGADTHLHAVATATSGPSATVNAPTGVGQTIPSASHTHNTNFNTGSADGKPPYLNVVWIIRIK
jgi:hypothetical protein